jgi:hypothetical protein
MISPNPQVAYVCFSLLLSGTALSLLAFDPQAPKITESDTLMPTILRKTSLLFAVFLALTGTAAINMATAQTKVPNTSGTTQADSDNQDMPDDELDAAAITLDVALLSTHPEALPGDPRHQRAEHPGPPHRSEKAPGRRRRRQSN